MPKSLFMFIGLFLISLFSLPVRVGAADDLLLAKGQMVYVPVYSHVFSGDRGLPFNLAATLSIRNTDPDNPLKVVSADYYDSKGNLLKRYFDQPVILEPLASTDIFIKERDSSGGFGANFLVRWESAREINTPIIECVMIGARSGQGISFVSPGKPIRMGTK